MEKHRKKGRKKRIGELNVPRVSTAVIPGESFALVKTPQVANSKTCKEIT